MAGASEQGGGGGGSGAGSEMVLRLYVAGNGPNSVAARANLRRILAASKRPHTLEIVDCLDEPLRALEEGVLVTPTLIRGDVTPPITIIGSLSDLARVREALGLAPPATRAAVSAQTSETTVTT